MLASITIEDFKSYRHATLPLAPLTLLIGANASGKSNAIEAIRLLSWLARGQRLSALQYEIQGSDLAVRGNTQDMAARGADSFGFACRFSGDLYETAETDTLSLKLRARGSELAIIEERLTTTRSTVPLYETKEPASSGSSDIRVAYDNFARGGIKPQIVCSNQQAVFTQLTTAARFQKAHEAAQITIPAVTEQIAEDLVSILILDPEPRAMRGYVHRSEVRPREDGSNVSAMLFGLWRLEENRDQLVNFIRSLPEQNIARLDFIETGRGDVMVQLVETFGGVERPVDAPLLSDGTLRVLAIAATLLSAPRESMVIIEEIDNGVHPSRAAQLMASIREVAEKRNLRVLLTTHNPALMDALPLQAVADVVFCYRDPEEGDSRLIRLSDLSDYPKLMAQGDLGELVTAGIVDRMVKERIDPEEKKKRTLKWIEELKSGSVA